MPSEKNLPLHHRDTVVSMRRKEVVMLRALLLWLLLAASRHHFPTFADARAIYSADSKLGPDEKNLYISQEKTRSTKGGEEKIRKTPSGPNPVGNHLPPSKKH